MNDDNKIKQDIGASAFYLANGNNPEPHAAIFYGNQHIPHPINKAAQRASSAAIMRAVIEGK